MVYHPHLPREGLLFHVTYSPIPLQRGLIAVPHPGLLMVVDGDTGQFLQDRDRVKALAGTTQLLLWLSTPLPCSAMRFLPGGWEQGPACFCCSPRDQLVTDPGHDPTGVYLITSCTSTMFMDSS